MSMANTIRETTDGSERIRIFGCYGFGSGGLLFWVSVPNSLDIRSPNGMSEADLRAKYPRMVKR